MRTTKSVAMGDIEPPSSSTKRPLPADDAAGARLKRMKSEASGDNSANNKLDAPAPAAEVMGWAERAILGSLVWRENLGCSRGLEVVASGARGSKRTARSYIYLFDILILNIPFLSVIGTVKEQSRTEPRYKLA